MRFAFAAVAAVALSGTGFILSPSQPPATRLSPVRLIAKGLAQAVAAGRLTPAEELDYRGELARADVEARRLPPLRAQLLEAVIADVAAQWRSYTRPRALTLFGTLTVSTDWLAGHALTGSYPDVVGG